MSHTQKCDFALTLKFVFFLVRGFEDAYAMNFSTEDVEAKRVDQKMFLSKHWKFIWIEADLSIRLRNPRRINFVRCA